MGSFKPDRVSQRIATLAKRGAVASFSILAITATLLGVRHQGGLQPLELAAYDQFVRLHSNQTVPDPRILVVTITEKDIRSQQKWPFSDQVVARLLSKLQTMQPAVIGLDLYRDIPIQPGQDELVAQLKQPNVIAIQNIDNVTGTPAPPTVPEEQVGFNDLAIDPDNVVRRNILFAENENGVLFSFSLRLALAYLEKQGIALEDSPSHPNSPQLGEATFLRLQKDAGGYQTIEADGYQILLNYRSPKNVARTVTMKQVLDGEVDPSWVNGKILLIGSTAPSLKDMFPTPFSPALEENPKMPGVFIHAQMVSQFLDAASGTRSPFWFWSERVEVLWILGWIAIACILARVTAHPLRLGLGIVVGVGTCTGIAFYLFTQAGWVPIAAPVLGFILSAGTIVTYRAYLAQQKQKIVMKLLGQNTSPEIAQELWQRRDRLLKSGKLPGISLTATMMFADIKDFSTISEQMTPEALLEWLNELLEMITQEVIHRQGIVNKFTGDGVIAVFGVPTRRLDTRDVDEDARGAVACALSISDRLEAMNQNWQRQGLPIIQMRIGIFTGPIVAGSLGGKERLEYGIIGDSVNIAARLESCEKHRQPTNCRILIGKETFVHLREQFEVESWGPLALKGKQQAIEVYRVVGRKRHHPPSVAA
ncbi:MAG TPA: adenylate/guanylate cyclase domain-containing protein [Coleofasciculaceae cyanobacterium]